MDDTSKTQLEHNAHREAFPDQYGHHLVGRRVRTSSGQTFEVSRVVPSRFGLLAPLPANSRIAFPISELEVIE